ncbi:hypothetical protein K491DRAFT_692029 [Lophiostoma macrostomum CBS 122681]|uniref:Uncharacterized protein n=1 Tax=Lophiostoma macrostomum CBS 122681 TaxID=1314788 RepID=A0A6A6TC43_9PLEO|nr:hypothetical protein K491DRAFT_692029 [Lophiostoma macrostomum CBS 122681]
MLTYPYKEKIPTNSASLQDDGVGPNPARSELLLLYLEIDQVADKYDMPDLFADTAPHQDCPDHASTFPEIVHKMYEATNGNTEIPFLRNVLDLGCHILGLESEPENGDRALLRLSPMYLGAITSNAEFGRDICALKLRVTLGSEPDVDKSWTNTS